MRLFISFVLLITVSTTYSQENPVQRLRIGDKVPVNIWKKIPKKASTRLVILDFWNTSCVSCMMTFSQMEELQKRFDDQLQIVLVDPWENEIAAKSKIAKINVNRIKEESKPYVISPLLRTVFGDAAFVKAFAVRGVPHHVWIDSTGRVRYITHSYNATPNHVADVLSGKPVKMLEKTDLKNEGFDPWKGFLHPAHASAMPAYYASFFRFNSGYGGGNSWITDSVSGMYRRVFINEFVYNLYRFAFGYTSKLLLEVKNKKDFILPSFLKEGDLLDDWYERNTFSYEIYLPVSEQENIREYMQQDVNRFFGIEKGIEGHVEKRRFKCLVLTKTTMGKLAVSGGDPKYKNTDSVVKLVNNRFRLLSDALMEKLEDMNAGRPFLDETTIVDTVKLDIQLTGNLKDWQAVRRQLQPYGLDIIEAEREVEVLIIRDKKKNL